MNAEREYKKVAFIGTSCTGKTSLLEACKELYGENSSIAFVNETARSFFQKNPNLEDRFSTAVESAILEQLIKNEETAHASDVQTIICDTSVLEAVVYVRAYGDIEGSERLFKRVSSLLPKYHKLFLMDPADVEFVNDEIRLESFDTRQLIHNTYLEFLSEKGIAYELLSGNVEQRLKRVDEIIKE